MSRFTSGNNDVKSVAEWRDECDLIRRAANAHMADVDEVALAILAAGVPAHCVVLSEPELVQATSGPANTYNFHSSFGFIDTKGL